MADEDKPGADESPQPEDETIELAYELFKDIPERQMQAVDALDVKAVQTFAAASVVAGFTVVGKSEGLCPEILAVALGIYLLAVAASVWALWPGKWVPLHGADKIWGTTWSYSASEFRHAMIGRIRQDAATNRDKIRNKANALRLALVLTGLEVVAVVVAAPEAFLR